MNAYPGEWHHDFNNIFYSACEGMKKNAYGILAYPDIPIEKRINAAENIIRSHFLRSAYTYIEEHDRRRVHPSFREYAAMMLNGNVYLHMFGEEIYTALKQKYGTMPGIESGTSYYRPRKK